MSAEWELANARRQAGHEGAKHWFFSTFAEVEVATIDSLWVQQRIINISSGIQHPKPMSETLRLPVNGMNSMWDQHGELNCVARDLSTVLFKGQRELAERCISFLLQREMKPLFAHFFITDLAERFYAEHEIDRCIDYCNMAVAISPDVVKEFKATGQSVPFSQAYARLCIIYEKKLNYDEAIRFATQAMSDGWGGDWERRIQRCTNKKNNVVDRRPALSKKDKALLNESQKKWAEWHKAHGWQAICTQCGGTSEGKHIKRESVFAETHSKEEAARLDLEFAITHPNGAGAWDKRYKIVSDLCDRCWKANQRARRQKSTLHSVINNLGKIP